MTAEERAALVAEIVAAAPPLSEHQAATIRRLVDPEPDERTRARTDRRAS